MRRSEQRQAAVFALYQHDLTGQALADALGPNALPFTRALAQAAVERSEELDAVIRRHARDWSLERIQPLERSIMRVALLEMLHPESVPGDVPIPPEGAIDEAVQTAKTFCSNDAPGFVNGVLAAALREVRENVGVGGPASQSDSAAPTSPPEGPQP